MATNSAPTFSTTFFNAGASNYGSHATAMAAPLIQHILDKYCSSTTPTTSQSPAPHPIGSTSSILDNACGPGVVTEILLSHLPPSSHPAELYMTDISPGMIAMVRKMLDTQASNADIHSKITPLVHDSQTLTSSPGSNTSSPRPLQPASFTHVFTNMAVYLFPSPVEALRQIHHLLAPGGISFTTAYVSMGNLQWHHAAQHHVRPDEEPFAGPAPRYWGNEENMRRALVEAGFERGKVSVERVSWEVDRRACPGPMRMQVGERLVEEWTGEEKKKFWAEFERVLAEKKVEEERYNGDMKVEMVALVGIGVK